MDNVFFNELCKEELLLVKEKELLVEKLRVLREFKSKFFNDDHTLEQETSKKPVQQYLFSETKGSQDTRQREITRPIKVLNALDALGTGKTKEVAAKMIEMYPEYQENQKKAINDARIYISSLLGKKIIEIHEKGNGSSGSSYKKR